MLQCTAVSMDSRDLLHSVEQAREQLRGLVARHAPIGGPGGGAPEIREALAELVDRLARLQTHYSMLIAIVARGADVLYAKDRDGRYLLMNPSGAALFGLSVDAIIGRDDTALFDAESAARVMAIDREVVRTGKPYSGEATYSVRGVQTTLSTTLTIWNEPTGEPRGLIGVTRDLTERRKVEAAASHERGRLRALASEVLLADERLRRALAVELQDGLGQDIALVKLRLATLRAATNAELAAALEPIERLVEQADRSLRSISFRLSPLALHDLGLIPALECLADEYGERHLLDVRIESSGELGALDTQLRMTLFRAVRQLLSNVSAHARTHTATVRVHATSESLRVVVEDSGAGFDPQQVESHGYGLFGIREQLARVGGGLSVRASRGAGTTATLTVPRPLVTGSPA